MTAPTRLPDTIDARQFPALARLRPGRGRRVPFVQQMEAADCGAACLAMVLAYHGHTAPLAEVRRAAGTSGGGTSATGLLRGAASFGLRGRGLQVDPGDLRHLAPATILHWEFNHFVVFERLSAKGVHLVDPSLGRRVVPLAQVGRSLTGVALELLPDDQFTRRAPGGSLTRQFLARMLRGSGGLTRIVVVSLLLQLFALAVPVLTGLVVDRVIPRGDTRLLAIVSLGLGFLVLFQALASVVRAHLLLQMRTNLDTRMTLGFLEHLVALPYAFFQRRSAGDLLMRVSSNQTIREILGSQSLAALLDGALVVIYLVLIVLADLRMAACVAGLGLVQLLVLLLARRRVQELESRSLEAQARSQSYLVQLISGIATLKLAGAERHAVERWSHDFAANLNADLAMGRTTALVDGVFGALRTATPMVVLGYGALRVLDGHMSLGTMLAVNSLAGAFLGPLASLVSGILTLQRVRGHLERIDDVLAVEPEQPPGRTPAPRLRGRVELERVSFRYAEGAPLALDDVSLTLEPGQSVAIVGASGSGKSTLAGLLLGLHRPDQGRVRFDGRDLGELELRSLRAQLGTVPQAPYFFDASVRENIALGDPEAPLDRVVAAARTACIHEDVAGMPMGYETLLADRGQSLSGGQRQRLALARALLGRPALLLLDEATSALDAETEARVMQNLRDLRMTRVSIAHRLSTVVDADLIVVMEAGRVVETGRHEQLLARRGRYHALVRAQLGAPGAARAA